MYKLITKANCRFCFLSKKLLKKHDIPFTEEVIGTHMTRERVLADYPNQKTVPIIIDDDGNLIGGYEQLVELMDKSE